MHYIVRKISNKSLMYSNCVLMNNNIFDYVKITEILSGKSGIFKVINSDIGEHSIELSDLVRKYLNVCLDTKVNVEEFTPDLNLIKTNTFNVKIINKNINSEDAKRQIKDYIRNFSLIPINYGCQYSIKSNNLFLIECNSDINSYFFIDEILFNFGLPEKKEIKENRKLSVASEKDIDEELITGNFDPKKLGIGGMGKSFRKIVQEALSSRILGKEANLIDTKSIRGILLYGPPGCGKTLIARQIGKILNAKTIKFVGGPEVMDKYVGESERKICELFVDAEYDRDNNIQGLHIIILDEIDSLAPIRKNSESSSANVKNDIVNQMLAKIDGVNGLDNILIIGMTNRKDSIDPAVIRPGRLELHIEITVPDFDGRKEIIEIKIDGLKKEDRLLPDFDIDKLAEATNNFTGAEIESVISKAIRRQFAMNINPITLKVIDKDKKTMVGQEDFLISASSIVPYMGKTTKEISIITKNPINLDDITFSYIYNDIRENLNLFYNNYPIEFEKNDIKRVLSGRNFTILLTGDTYSGKTKMIAHIVQDIISKIHHIKFITPEYYMSSGTSLWSEFEEGRRMDSFLMVIDSLETIISSSVLSKEATELRTIIGCNIPNDKLIATIVICSNQNLINSIGIKDKFLKTYDL